MKSWATVDSSATESTYKVRDSFNGRTLDFQSKDNSSILLSRSIIKKTYEKKLIVFPARMNHGVMPFYSSDGYRISVSGNLEVNK